MKTIPAKHKHSKPYSPCYTSHPPLDIGGYLVYGGSCSTPVVKDAAIYIGFDHSMSFHQTTPWAAEPKYLDVFSHIQDMSTPKDAVHFVQLIAWAADQIRAGKKLHAGCIGGHGRTGLFLAALVTHMTGNKNSIEYVRANYCSHAVETKQQATWLATHFGVTVPANFSGKYDVLGFSGYGYGSGSTLSPSLSGFTGQAASLTFSEELDTALGGPTVGDTLIQPMPAEYSIL